MARYETWRGPIRGYVTKTVAEDYWEIRARGYRAIAALDAARAIRDDRQTPIDPELYRRYRKQGAFPLDAAATARSEVLTGLNCADGFGRTLWLCNNHEDPNLDTIGDGEWLYVDEDQFIMVNVPRRAF